VVGGLRIWAPREPVARTPRAPRTERGVEECLPLPTRRTPIARDHAGSTPREREAVSEGLLRGRSHRGLAERVSECLGTP